MFARITACALAVLILVAAPPTRGQEVDRIAAVVNDEIISNRDLEDRVKMAMVFSHLPDNLENRRRVIPQVLRKIIDERLQMQEAKRLKVTLSAKDIEGGIAGVEAQNGMPKGALLKGAEAQGVSADLVRSQMIPDLTWMRLAVVTIQPNIRIGDGEINDRLEIIKSHRGKPEYLLSEIFLAIDSGTSEEQVRNLGERLLDQLHQGAPFAMLAGQFSQSATAANGGSMGWLSADVLDEDLSKVVATLAPGQISVLIRQDDGYHIYGLAAKRIAGAGRDEDATVVVAQMMLPVPAAGGPPKQALAARAAQITQPAQSCDALEEIGRKLGEAKVARVGPVRVGELAPPLQRIIGGLAAGKASEPLDAGENIQVLMVCSRKAAGESPMPTADQIRRIVEDERLDMQLRRYLRDLRRAAFIDIRM
jgi:peptidyl-prolyl cis-trans isomerase SurA